MKKHIQLGIPGRESLSLEIQLTEAQQIESVVFEAIGNLQFLHEAQLFRESLKGDLQEVPCPQGRTTGALLLKEALLKMQDRWAPPYEEEELCHCRVVLTQKVHMAILTGAHTPEEVSLRTSASTNCGTCRPDVEALIDYRLN